jgi:hypothetical protein
MTFVSRWFKAGESKNSRQTAPVAASRHSAGSDSNVAFVAGEGARVYSLDAFRRLKNLPVPQPTPAA